MIFLFIFFVLAGELFIFYSIFYIVLAILFAICMKVWMGMLNDKEPKWLLDESRIGDSPGLGFRPMPKSNQQGSLIAFNITNISSIEEYTRAIDIFLESKCKTEIFRFKIKLL